MERGLYAAASGMLAQQSLQDVIAANIANANTVGYKQDNATFRAVQGQKLHRLNNGMGGGPEIGDLGAGVRNDRVVTDWQAGPLAQTSNPLDASLGDRQFFAIQTRGGERYTRAGNFHLDGTGRLLSATGQPVLDTNNQPIIARGQPSLDNVGNVLVNGQPIARLKIVQADTNGLIHVGDGQFAATNPAAITLAARPQVLPGTLEQSNVSPVRSLVQLIGVTRGFDIAQRALVTQDELLRHAATEVGKL